MGPIVRVQIEDMKHTLIQHLASYRDEWDRIATEELKAALAEPALREEIRRQARQVIVDAVSERIRSSVRDAIWAPEMSATIRDIAVQVAADLKSPDR